jgi:hypothetical protein
MYDYRKGYKIENEMHWESDRSRKKCGARSVTPRKRLLMCQLTLLVATKTKDRHPLAEERVIAMLFTSTSCGEELLASCHASYGKQRNNEYHAITEKTRSK